MIKVYFIIFEKNDEKSIERILSHLNHCILRTKTIN